MTKPRFVITTVGTSLIEKLGRESIDGQGNKLFDNNSFENIKMTCRENNGGNAETKYKSDQSDVKSVLCKLKGLNSSTDHIFAPAEIASLWKLNLDKNNCKVALVYSDTYEGVFCSVVLTEYVGKNIASSCERKRIEGLQSRNSQEFKDKG